MKVELIDHMGSDLSVVNAARVSFDKRSEWKKITHYEDRVQRYTPPINSRDWDYGEQEITTKVPITSFILSERDTKLISYLAKHNHWTPFAHTSLSFRIKAPLFVARQLGKHQVGLVWNEVSRRYVDSEPEFYMPEVWRKRADNVKQGSSDEAVDMHMVSGVDLKTMHDQLRYLINDAQAVYRKLLAEGVCPEQARMVLPQSMMTEWVWTGSLAAFARVCKLRLAPHTQRETQYVAMMIAKEANALFPVSWAALMENT